MSLKTPSKTAIWIRALEVGLNLPQLPVELLGGLALVRFGVAVVGGAGHRLRMIDVGNVVGSRATSIIGGSCQLSRAEVAEWQTPRT